MTKHLQTQPCTKIKFEQRCKRYEKNAQMGILSKIMVGFAK
jgi:hypothetical protein